MGQDLAHKRPWLLASLLAGLSFPATWLLLPIEGSFFAIIWKMAAVGFLVPFALRRHHEGEFVLLAIMLAFYALGDGLIEFSMIAGALAFAAGHLVAIWLYFRHRRVGPTFSQKLLAVAIFAVDASHRLFPAADTGGGRSGRRLQHHLRRDGRNGVEQQFPPLPRWHGRGVVRDIRPADFCAPRAAGRFRSHQHSDLVSLLFRRPDDRGRRRADIGQARALSEG